MQWLEVGCPFCPTVVTFPRAAAGRTVRCPECGKSYLIPAPPVSSVPELPKSAAALPSAPAVDAAMPAAVQAEAEDSLAPTIYDPLIPPPTAPFPEPPARPRSTLLPEVPAAHSPRRPPEIVARSAAGATEDAWEPELDRNSPLAELPILDPPRLGRGNSGKATVVARQRPASRESRRDEQAASLAPSEPTTTLFSNDPPFNTTAAALEAAAEAQARMLRAEMRAKANLILLIGGTLLMIGFAFFVVKLTRG